MKSDTPVYVDDFVVYQDVYQYVPTSADMKKLVEEFEKEEEFANDRVAHALKVHLTAIDRFEIQGEARKVIKHMHGFKQLLDYQQRQERITDRAYTALKSYTESLVQQYIGADLDKEQLYVTHFGDHPITLALENHTTESIDVELVGNTPENVRLELDDLVQINAGETIEIDGNVRTSQSLLAGEHQVAIEILVDGYKIQEVPLIINVIQNLVENFGFEELDGEGASAWRASNNWSSEAITVSSEEAFAGDRSIKIATETNDNHWVMQNVEVEGGKMYELSAWLKSNDPNGRARMKVEFYHDTDGHQGEVSSKYFYPSEEWQNIKMEVESPTGANRARLFLRFYAPGTVYYDDVVFR